MNQFSGSTSPLSQAGLDAVNHALGCDPCALWSLITVETSGYGFLPSRRPKILFERHQFSRLTQHRYDATHPGISAKEPGAYATGPDRAETEYERLGEAMALDHSAALKAASWGLGQIMGFNATDVGYASVEAMVDVFCDGEDAQLDGIRRFIARNQTLSESIRSKRWPAFASIYNGPNYARNEYDSKLDHYFRQYSANGVPNVDIRAAQARLSFLKYAPGGIDGISGKNTIGALNAFQRAHGLPVTSGIDAATRDALRSAAGF